MTAMTMLLRINHLTTRIYADQLSPRGDVELYHLMVAFYGRAEANRRWTDLCIAYDREHCPECFDDR